MTSENPPLNLAGAALVPGLGNVNVDNVGILHDALDNVFDSVVLSTVDNIPLAGVKISVYNELWKFIVNLPIKIIQAAMKEKPPSWLGSSDVLLLKGLI